MDDHSEIFFSCYICNNVVCIDFDLGNVTEHISQSLVKERAEANIKV